MVLLPEKEREKGRERESVWRQLGIEREIERDREVFSHGAVARLRGLRRRSIVAAPNTVVAQTTGSRNIN
jgi:hypothetical protein